MPGCLPSSREAKAEAEYVSCRKFNRYLKGKELVIMLIRLLEGRGKLFYLMKEYITTASYTSRTARRYTAEDGCDIDRAPSME
jgi:hypothetical protein